MHMCVFSHTKFQANWLRQTSPTALPCKKLEFGYLLNPLSQRAEILHKVASNLSLLNVSFIWHSVSLLCLQIAPMFFGRNILTAILAIMKRLNAVYSSHSIDLSQMQLCANFQLSGTKGSEDIKISIFCGVGQLGLVCLN